MCSPYSENDIKQFYKAKERFQEIPVEQLDEKQWRLCIRKPFVHAEDIFLLEGRAALAAVRHASRSLASFGKDHLSLGDNLGNILSLEKRRAHSFDMLCICRSVGALSLALDACFLFRWHPSELNVADKPSRAFEPAPLKFVQEAGAKHLVREVDV